MRARVPPNEPMINMICSENRVLEGDTRRGYMSEVEKQRNGAVIPSKTPAMMVNFCRSFGAAKVYSGVGCVEDYKFCLF